MHTINPSSGFPVEHSLLSASVIAPDCMTADAFATAFMVLGVDKSIAIIERLSEIEALLIFQDADGMLKTYHSAGIDPIFMEKGEES